MTLINSYSLKEPDYFGHARREIESLLPPELSRVLEIGCGNGATLEWLKREKGCRWACGIEIAEEPAEKAKEIADFFIQGDIERIDIPITRGSLDLVLCLDVLEHLYDPWNVVERLSMLLRPGGIMISSIPNVRHPSVVIPLLFFNKWDYVPAGILDRTHLRFFTRETAIELFEPSGLKVDKIKPTMLERNSWKGMLNILTLRLFQNFLAWQFLLRVRKIGSS